MTGLDKGGRTMSEPEYTAELFEPETAEPPEPAAAFTERDLLDRLRARHGQTAGNGPVWTFMEHVRDAAGFDARTTIDALALHQWPSMGHEVHAFEVKVSRSDFRREIRDLDKSAPWRSWVDYFWIVAPRGVVPTEEMPEGWGLLVTHGTGLTTWRRAKRLTPPQIGCRPREPIPRGLVASMLRACARTAAHPLDELEGRTDRAAPPAPHPNP